MQLIHRATTAESGSAHGPQALPRTRGRLKRLVFAPIAFALFALASVSLAEPIITGGIHGNSVTYTANLGSSSAGAPHLVTIQNTSTGQGTAHNTTANQAGQIGGTAHFGDGGIRGGDTVVVSVYTPGPNGPVFVASAAFTKPRPPAIVRWARALVSAVQEVFSN